MPDQSQTETLPKRQQVLADFGEFALESQDLDEVLTEACRLVAEALGTVRAKIPEIQEDRQSLLVRAGVGWDHRDGRRRAPQPSRRQLDRGQAPVRETGRHRSSRDCRRTTTNSPEPAPLR
jgi:GAF domain-containing protein